MSDGTIIHTFLPGPDELGFQGEIVEPQVITHFNGFSAMAYINGTATDAEGNSYNMSSDIRAYQGTFIADDGSVNFGTFAFV